MSKPKVAYILLWCPKPSETFIFREVVNLWRFGLDLTIYTLYGEIRTLLSPEMTAVSSKMIRLGLPYLKRAPFDLFHWWRRNPQTTTSLLRTVPLRKWRSLEVAGENIWAFFAGFTLARLFQEQGIEHIHAPWANGPATAAWVASRLTDIPFSFMGRAVDIHPPDGALREKMRDAVFVRTNPCANVDYLRQFAEDCPEKIWLSYDGYPLRNFSKAPVRMKPPFRLLSLGRFARFKGMEVLLKAARILSRAGMDYHLVIAGSGLRGVKLKALCSLYGLKRRVSWPGFITHEKVPRAFHSADVFVMPSVIHASGERDGIPNVVIEALLNRVPVVASNVAGIGEVIRDGETGLLVPQRNPETLADAIVRMTADRDRAIAMAEKGRQLVKEMFDPEKCHRELLAMFARVINPGEFTTWMRSRYAGAFESDQCNRRCATD